MKSLKAALALNKRKREEENQQTQEQDSSSNKRQTVSSSAPKYIRMSEVNKTEQERLSRLVHSLTSKEKQAQDDTLGTSTEARTPGAASEPSSELSDALLNNQKVMHKLRQLRQPIRLFGETNAERVARLKEAQLHWAEHQSNSGGQRNTLADIVKQTELEDAELAASSFKHTDNGASTSTRVQRVMDHDEKYAEQKSRESFQTRKQYLRHTIKHWLYLWEREVRSEQDARLGTNGVSNSEVISYKDTMQKMRPFFKRLHEGDIGEDMLEKIENVCKLCQQQEYILAIEEYLKVSIGNAPWPMGATMVGIHERSGRDKISSDKIAHIMNDEVTRSYLHGFKRLISFVQSKYPTVPSKMIKY